MNTNINKKTPISEQNAVVAEAPRHSTAEMTDDEKIDAAAERILKEYRRAFEELAK